MRETRLLVPGPLTSASRRLGHTARRLRRSSAEELWVRGTQAVNVYLERLGFRHAGREPSEAAFRRMLHPEWRDSAEGLLDRLRNSGPPCHFFSAFDEPDNTLAAIREHAPEHEDFVLSKARRIQEGRFDLLGYRDLTFGHPIDWQYDPLSGTRAPFMHWSRIPYLDATCVGDHKVIWELNRHQFFTTLGQAYWFSRDEAYAQTFAAQITAWMDANPPGMGINWASSLEVAFRTISWLWALHYFRHSTTLTPALYRRVLGWLYLHGRHIETYLSTFFSPNTHLTGEALGLFYLGLLLPELNRAERWRTTGHAILEREVARQVLPDGVYFEQASYYQKYTADFYLHFVALAGLNDLSIQAATRARVEALLEHLMYLQRPDGRSPLIGDDDGGMLVALGDAEPNDFRGTLATAAILFERPDYCFLAGPPSAETMWLLGKAGADRLMSFPKTRPGRDSHAFPDGGYYIMRDGWDERADYMVIDCGNHGSETGGHAHADVLSFEVTARGKATLIDPGTYTYTTEPRWREYFRSSAAHNTVTVDGVSSSVPIGPFRWEPVAQATLHAWRTHPRFDFFEGSHDGFKRLDPPANHVRSILFIKGMGWIIRDVVESAGPRAVGVHFHCTPEFHGSKPTDSTLRLGGPDSGLLLAVCARAGALEATGGWVAPVYGRLLEAPAFTFEVLEGASITVFTFLVSCRQDPLRYRVSRLECDGGSAFRITKPEGSFDILCGDGGAVTTPQIATDASWASLMRGPTGEPIDLILLDGSRITIDGIEALADGVPPGCFLGRWTEGRWDMAADIGGGA